MSRFVLVVDDAPFAREALSLVLMQIPGVVVFTVGSLTEALQVLAGPVRIQAICTDLDMPHGNGFELIQTARANRNYEQIPILVISANTEESTPARVRELGANAFFLKPFSPFALRQTLEQLLDANQANPQ